MTRAPARAAGAPRPGFLATALARAEAWLLEPDLEAEDARCAPRAESEPPLVDPPLVKPPLRPVIAVVGLAARCGSTTVARGLGAELGARDAAGAAIVSTRRPAPAGALRTPSAGRLARSLTALGLGPARACGRVCLIGEAAEQAAAATARRLAPIVLDAGYGTPPAAVAGLADRVVLVTMSSAPPGLAEVVAASLAGHAGGPPLVVANRAAPGEEEVPCADVVLPEARAAAQLSLMGCPASGALGVALAELADRADAST